MPTDFSHVYAGLKDFQQATVEHVAARLYGDPPVPRFLVADEVGLGKTLVATGVVAKTIEHHLAKDTKRIDIIYICSNGEIARQNTARLVNRLAIPGLEDVRPIDRMTLLPRAARELNRQRVNIVALTPGTSFSLRSSEGIAEERMLLYTLLWDEWGADALKGNPSLRVFAGWSGFERFAERARRYRRQIDLDQELSRDFHRAVRARDQESRRRREPTLRDEFDELRQLFYRDRDPGRRPREHFDRRRDFIGELRALLARTCIYALKPELVILDEFQRFKGLLDGTDPASDLANVLFEYPDVRLLLLSATPYKMYTVADDTDDDHYADLVRTLRFLGGENMAAGFSDDLRGFRRRILAVDGDRDFTEARSAKTRIEQTLRSVVVRTERLASTPDRSGMLMESHAHPAVLEAADVSAYLGLEKVTQLLDGGPVLDFWKDTAYPLNFMEDYKLSRAFNVALSGNGNVVGLAEIFDQHHLLLSWDEVVQYQQLDPANARLRSLMTDVMDSGAWQLAWLPPALPYYELGPPWNDPDLVRFSKRLVFSAWKVVPKVIGAMLSYETERRLMTSGGRTAQNTAEAHEKFRPLLQVTRSAGRLTGMPVFVLVYPSPELARLGDPRAIAAELGAAGETVGLEPVLAAVRQRVATALEPLVSEATGEGPPDERWYWAAPLLLDQAADGSWNREWWAEEDLANQWLSQDDQADGSASEGWKAHVDQARDLLEGRVELGRPPDDLIEVLAELTVGGPAVTVLRALARQIPVEGGVQDPSMRDWAAYIAWQFRSLFNQPELTNFLRSTASTRRREDTYWRLVLRYCLNGCLQAVLDEYFHVLVEALGVAGAPADQALERIGNTVSDSQSIRTANYAVEEIVLDGANVEAVRHRMRGRFALRFGDDRGDEERSAQRQTDIRSAFNSPFWPFVLATTSVGQEGLDFHQYCHAVVHWNLPSNPVDLEQREGRVHRYKGHAVRKNVATAHRAAAFGPDQDPWTALFSAAAAGRDAAHSELVPYWVYPIPGGAQIERHVPALPLSRDRARLEALRRSLAIYRLVFGQPRQDDLVAYLQTRFSEDEIKQLQDELRIDLSPSPLASAPVGEV